MDAQMFGRIFKKLSPTMTERDRRLFAAAGAQEYGYGGVSAISQATGVSRRAIHAGNKELTIPATPAPQKIRRKGAGRKPNRQKDLTLEKDLESLVDPMTRGEPDSPLRWTCKSTRKLADELKTKGHHVSHTLVSQILADMDYSLQANQKVREGSSNPDRNAQFEYINERVKAFQESGQPVISVDTKKKELVGDFKNGGREYQPKGDPEKVRVHDFMDKYLGKVAPYGIYDITGNTGWVNVGISHDTAAFAVNSIRQWWFCMGRLCYPNAKNLLITADGGGSNGYRVKLWKVELQKLAVETGLSISVSHLPPGTSKWNKIEHCLFSFITQNWRGRPLLNIGTIINLIAATTTKTGLKVACQLDTNKYEKGIQISDTQIDALNITREAFHGEWNYTIAPPTH